MSGHLFDKEDSVDFVLKPTTTSVVRFHQMTKRIQRNRPFKLNAFNLDIVLDLKKGALIGMLKKLKHLFALIFINFTKKFEMFVNL